MSLAGIRACVFDAYGTLLDLGALVPALAREIGADKAERVAAVWRAKQLEYSWLRTLMGRHADFGRVTAEALDYALAAEGMAATPGLMASFYERLPAYPEVTALLDAVRGRGLKTAILSNGAPAILLAAAESAELTGRLDAVLSVEAVGLFKPHPAVYELATRRFSVLPSEICFVSANGWDIAGAANAGFQAVWLNRRGLPPERLPAGPVATITTLSELAALLPR